MRPLHLWAAAAAVGVAVAAPSLLADEGMWLYTAPPLKQLKDKYGFEPTKEWLDHLQKSSVRFNSGGSGSFVSPDGLVMTNHHVGADDLQKLSDLKKVDYLKLGFEAKTHAEELKCPDLILDVLQSIADVTAEVKGAVTADMTPADAVKARQQKIEELQKAGTDKAKGVRADVVTLFAGGAYHLYTFKTYTDIRLVFAPEKQIAFFGGDPDNFEFPRFDLDMCFFRVYEDDKPLKCDHHLKWSAAGAKDGELTFVSGHPGRTNRQNTVAELEYLRDVGYPNVLSRLARLEVLLGSWVARSEENRKKGEDDLFGIQNSRKARIGGLQGLLDPKLFARKKEEEKKLRAFIETLPAAEREAGLKAFDTIAASQKKRAEYLKESVAYGFNSTAFGTAQTLLRYADEMKKDPKDRLPEFGETRLPSLKRSLLSPVPVEVDYETLKMADSLSQFAIAFGSDHEMVKQVLAGKSPQERAYELVSGTRVTDLATRTKWFEGKEAPESDPMIAFAKLVDEPMRALRKKTEAEVDEPKRQASAVLAAARSKMEAGNTYPDATFTLRLAYGPVKGYTENGKQVPAFTTMAGLYERSKEQGNKGPFELPERWEKKKQSLDLSTPFNFVSTADIIGGNSGSPVVNKAGEVVGLIFDGNIQSLVLDFIYDDTQARAVSVDSRAMIEALRKVYDAAWLADELQGNKK
jgi:hypothetical protein